MSFFVTNFKKYIYFINVLVTLIDLACGLKVSDPMKQQLRGFKKKAATFN